MLTVLGAVIAAAGGCVAAVATGTRLVWDVRARRLARERELASRPRVEPFKPSDVPREVAQWREREPWGSPGGGPFDVRRATPPAPVPFLRSARLIGWALLAVGVGVTLILLGR